MPPEKQSVHGVSNRQALAKMAARSFSRTGPATGSRAGAFLGGPGRWQHSQSFFRAAGHGVSGAACLDPGPFLLGR